MKKIALLIALMVISLVQSQTAAPSAAGKNSWDVISIFSGDYTDLASTNFNPNWGQSGFGSFTTPSYDGNAVKQYANLNYQGTETAADVDVSSFTKLHIDLYSPTLTSIRLSVIKTTAGAVEKPITLALTAGQWNSFDIDLTSATFTGLDLTKIKQFKYDNPSSNGQTLIVDNIYFYRDATTQPPTFSTPFTVASPKTVGDATFELTAPTSNSDGAFTFTSSNTNVATISGTTVTIIGAGNSTITASQAADGIYGSGTATAVLTVNPSAAPTQPSRNAWDVVSLYSDNYTPTVGSTWQTGADVSLSGNNARFFNGFTMARLAFVPVNLTTAGMTHLHLSVYSQNQNQLWFELQGNRRVESSIALNGWVEFNIPLSEYVGLNLTNISFFDLNNPTGAADPVKVVYMDDVYFYRAATTQPPTFSTTFTVASPKTLGDATFELTAPTSNSAGAFTFTSSNTNVATISGTTVTIIGVGTSTITASQAADGSYGSGTATAVLTVNYPLPVASPIPPARNAWDVVSMFTGTPTTYANAVTAQRASWTAGTTLSTIANGTDTCLQVDNFGFLGYITNAANFSVVGMTTVHVDIYLNTPITNMFIVLLAPGDQLYNSGPLVAGWNSLDIPLSSFPAGQNLANINGFKFEHNQGAARQIFLDNIYFYRDATIQPPTFSTTFTVASPKTVGDATFELTAPTSNSVGTFTFTSSNTNVATISGTTVTIIGAGNSTITASQAADGIYGAKTATAVLTVNPSAAPTQPSRNAEDVVSLYSGDYTATTGAGWQTGADVSLSGNNARFFNGFTLARLAFAPVNLTTAGMTHLHLSVYSQNQNQLWFELQGNRRVESSIALNGWVEFNIPLSEYVGLNLTNISFFDLNNPTGAADPVKVVYMDDVYFYKKVTPAIGSLTVPAKNIGDAAFGLTDPTSDSSGAFTYTSSNTAVATISGSTITIVGSGSSTITATQAATGSYNSGSVSATLTVGEEPKIQLLGFETGESGGATIQFGDMAAPTVVTGTGTNTSSVLNITANAGGAIWQGSNFTLTRPVKLTATKTMTIDVLSSQPVTFLLKVNGGVAGAPEAAAQASHNGDGTWQTISFTFNTSLDGKAATANGVYNNMVLHPFFPFDGPASARTFYIDNIKGPIAIVAPTLSNFSVTAKTVGDSFELTAPTTNSDGTFTYTSSNTAVATISGTTVSVVGAGNVIITATQAAGSYNTLGTITATFTASNLAVPTIGALTVPAAVAGGAPFIITAPNSTSTGDFTYTSSNTAVATISGSTVTIIGVGTSTITATQAATGSYESGTVTAVLTVNPSASPTQPIRNAWDVISIFSGDYTDLASTNFNPNWGQSGFGSFTTPSFEGNAVKQYANLNYQGTETAADVDVSSHTKLHIDLFSPTLTSIRLSVIKTTAGAVEKPITLALTAGQWNSFDIDLTSATFTGLDLTKIKQFKYDNPSSNGQTLIVDNIYFYRDATTQPPTFSTTFTVASPKTVGDATFELTAPTSNSVGTFTFTSSNTNVATISGTTVTIIGAGTSTITASQAADGIYGSGTATAVLTVNPSAAPTQPSRNAEDVVSLYSDDYAATTGAGWQTGADVSLSGNNARFFNGFTLARLAFAPVNLTTAGMTHLHLSVYSQNQNQLWFELQGNRRVESSIALNGWVEFNIPLSEYVGLNLTNISFFDLNNPTGAADPVKVVYMDDIYFYKEVALGTQKFETSSIKMYPNPVKNTLNIDANGTIEKVSVYSILGQEVMSKFPKSNSTTLETNELQKGTYIVKSTIDGKTATSKFIKE